VRHTARASPSASRARRRRRRRHRAAAAALGRVMAMVFLCVHVVCFDGIFVRSNPSYTHARARTRAHTHAHAHTVLDVSTTRTRLPWTHDIPHPLSPHRITPTQASYVPQRGSSSHISLFKTPIHGPINRPVASPDRPPRRPGTGGDGRRARRHLATRRARVARRTRRRSNEREANAASRAIAVATLGRTRRDAHRGRSVERSLGRVSTRLVRGRPPCRARRRRRADEG